MYGKIKYYFLRFYLRPFLTFFVSFWILIYINSRDQTHFMHHAGLLIFLVIGLTILFGSANMFLDKYFLPADFEKLVEKRPFRSFIKNGFCVANGYLSGSVDGYQVLLGYQIKKEQTLRKLFVNIVFKPNTFGHYMTEEELQKLNVQYHKDNFSWSINSLDFEFEFDGLPPRFDHILEEIKVGISVLKNEGFEPSTLADSYNVEKEIWNAILTENI